jgi:alkanesulfonate monooxygenase SsuD/methylene tetrahydromethanopterin reductase-like flavin-dependent oxidoreductase (luciferase family)
MSRRLEGILLFWLDRPDEEATGSVPFELLERVCAVGSADELVARISAYHDAGADVVGVAPSTAEDPGGRGVLSALSDGFRPLRNPQSKELAS